MPSPRKHVPVALSERYPVAGARAAGPVDPDERLTVTVYVRRNPNAPPLPSADEAAFSGFSRHLSDEEFQAAYGADPADIEKVVEYARSQGLEVLEASPLKRSVSLAGSASAMASAFGVELQRYEAAGETYRGRTGPVYVVGDLGDVVEAVLGLDDRRVGEPRVRFDPRASLGITTTRTPIDIAYTRGVPPFTYLPTTVADLYRFPPGTDGSGQCVAILCFNEADGHGGYSRPALQTYFESVLRVPMPDLSEVVVHGQGNDPGDDTGRDPWDTSAEMMLDIQMVGGIAPKAKLVAYFTQFTEQGWVDVINTIVTDMGNRPSVISISYGNPEDDQRSAWTRMAIRKVNEAFEAAAARGMTICCASGDDGSRDQAGDGRAHVDFPASSPFVLGCGGTRVIAFNGVIAYEAAWNDGPGSATGGGVSRFFSLPRWQQAAGVPPSVNPDHHIGRGVPDVSGIGDPETGVLIITLDGQNLAVIGGTSVTAPLWAALVARLNQALGRQLGFLNPLLYGPLSAGVMRDIMIGNNGAYGAKPGWDACTGLGSPDGVTLLAALQAMSRAPQPQAPEPTELAIAPFQAAYRDLVDALHGAWTSSAEAETPEAAQARFREGAAVAYSAYLRAIHRGWSKVDPARLMIPDLIAIGQSLIASAGQAAEAARLVPSGD